jgi:hypothetical protein
MERDFVYTDKLKNLSSSPEKSRSLLRQGAKSEKFELIAAERAPSTRRDSVMKMCACWGYPAPAFATTSTPSMPTGRSAAPRSSSMFRRRIEPAAAPTVCATTTTSCSDGGRSSPAGLPPLSFGVGSRCTAPPSDSGRDRRRQPASQPPPLWSRCRQQRSPRVPPYSPSSPWPRSAVTQALRSTTAQSLAGGAPQPWVHDEPVPARQPAYGFAVHAQPARQELSNEKR